MEGPNLQPPIAIFASLTLHRAHVAFLFTHLALMEILITALQRGCLACVCGMCHEIKLVWASGGE